MYVVKATLVLDTSALLENLQLIKELANFAHVNHLELLIPRETLKELDRIKDRENMQSKLGASARSAINWINTVFKQQDVDDFPALRGQRISESLNPNLQGDDAILDCAVYNLKNTSRFTVLTSNDHNLCNRAVIEGVETLETSASGVTPERVFKALADRTKDTMDLDELDFSSSSSAPLNASTSSPHIDEVDMHDEAPSLPPSAPKDMPPPYKGQNMEERVMNSIYNLIDWHLRRTFNDEELSCLRYYNPPNNPKTMARVLKQFSTTFQDFVDRSRIQNVLDAVKRGVIDKEYILSHIKLLQALSLYNDEYVRMLSKYLD